MGLSSPLKTVASTWRSLTKKEISRVWNDRVHIEEPRFSEVTSYSTPAKLIAPGVVVPGTLSITATDLFFDADEENPLYKKQDPKVGLR